MTLTALDLFSGIGGFSLACRWHGVETVGFCEVDEFCQRVLRKNWPDVPIHGDIHTLDIATINEWLGGRTLDFVLGGFPCQPWSLAGKRMGEEDDRALWPQMLRVIREARPRMVLAENVTGIITLGLDRVLADLEALSYTCRPVVVPACALNAPHRRDRVWLMAHADSEPERRQAVKADSSGDRRTPRVESQFGGDRLWFTGTASSLAVSDSRRRDGRSHIEGEGPTERGRTGGNGQTLADANEQRSDGTGPRSAGRNESADSRLHDPHANGTRPQGRGERLLRSRERVARKMGAESFLYSRQAQSGLGVQDDGLSRLLDGRLARPWDTDWETGVPRVSDGCVDRVNKLKALGNAIVPQVAYVLMGGMMEA